MSISHDDRKYVFSLKIAWSLTHHMIRSRRISRRAKLRYMVTFAKYGARLLVNHIKERRKWMNTRDGI